MKPHDIPQVLRIVRKEIRRWREPSVTQVARTRDPFRVLISCLISLRTKDAVTTAASRRLYRLATTPATMARLTAQTIEHAIYPAGFYKTKARTILGICADLLARYDAKVPNTIEALLTLQGVGRKTANLVVTLGFGKPGICVDVHVHRICNRWGYITTATPDASETALRDVLPRRYWRTINELLVTYGQNVCTPLSPHCSVCKLETRCAQAGVDRRR